MNTKVLFLIKAVIIMMYTLKILPIDDVSNNDSQIINNKINNLQ